MAAVAYASSAAFNTLVVTGASDPQTISQNTTPVGSNLAIVVGVIWTPSVGNTFADVPLRLSGVTYDGAALTNLTAVGVGTLTNECYYGVGLTSGVTKAVVGTLTSDGAGLVTVTAALELSTYQNVDQTTPIAQSTTGTSTGSTLSVSLTTASTDNMLADVSTMARGGTTTTVTGKGAAQTQRTNSVVGTLSSRFYALQSDRQGTGGSDSESWTFSATGRSSGMILMELATAPAATTRKSSTLMTLGVG